MQYLEIIFYVLFVATVFSFASLAPWMPTRKMDLGRINEIVKLKYGEKFLEIGCGTSGVSLYLARHNPASHIIGIELSPVLFIISKLRKIIWGTKNLEIIYGNALKLDFTQYDAIYIFGLPDSMGKKLTPKLQNILDKNFRLISYCFQLKNNIFQEKKYKPSLDKYAIYEYKLKK